MTDKQLAAFLELNLIQLKSIRTQLGSIKNESKESTIFLLCYVDIDNHIKIQEQIIKNLNNQE